MMFYKYDKKKMTYQRITMFPYIVLIICSILLLSVSKGKEPIADKENEPAIIEVYTGEEPFTFQAFKQFVLDCHIKFPDIVIAQALQESGFKSDIWKENNNPFGMKIPGRRNSTNIGENRGHAKFKNWKMAVIDYAYMQAVYARNIKTRQEYYEYLKSYAEDGNYAEKIKSHIRKYKGFGISNDYLNDL